MMLQLNAYVSAEELQRDIAFVKADSKQNTKGRWMTELKPFTICIVLAFLFVRYVGKAYLDIEDKWLFILTGFLFVSAIIASVLWIKHGGMADWLKKCSGNFTWQLNTEGINVRINESSTLFAWGQIIALVESDDAWHFYLRRNLAISIPKSACEHPHYFANIAAQYWRKHPDNAGLILPNTLIQGLQQKSFWADLSTNLQAGLQLSFFAKVSALSFKVRTSQWLALIALEVLIIAVFDYCIAGVNPQFNVYGITEYSANYLLFLLAGLSITSLVAAPNWFPRLMVILLAAGIALQLIYFPLQAILMMQDGNGAIWLNWFVWGVYIVWILLVVGHSVRQLFNYPMPTILLFTTCYSFFVLAIPGLLTDQRFFTEDYEAKYNDVKEKEIDIEATYYKQAQLVDEAIKAIKPQRAGQVDLYYIGFAGYAYQKVFSNEVKFAKKLLDEKHYTAGRSTLLINHQDSVDITPLANSYNLASTLDGLAGAMDKDEDVLFLFLSSHGSKDFKLSTDFYPFGSSDLSASKLKQLLDKSGIKNRIIVVSACYSGGFIDVLKDEYTLILTASKKDRNSFGCIDDADYTYFGDAYFIQALKEERSFVKAFEIAKKLIYTKERREQKGSPSSEPQMFLGSAIKSKLTALESSLKDTKSYAK